MLKAKIVLEEIEKLKKNIAELRRKCTSLIKNLSFVDLISNDSKFAIQVVNMSPKDV